MRKHNAALTRRLWGRDPDDRTNAAQQAAHSLQHSKPAQFATNGLLRTILKRLK